MGLFTGRNVAGARRSGQFEYVQDGHYYNVLLGTKSVIAPTTRQPALVFEQGVLKVIDDAGGKANRPGSIVSDYVNAGGEGATMFEGTIKSYLMGMLDLSEEEVEADPDGFNEICQSLEDGRNPLKGIVVEVKAWTIITKKNQKPYVRKNYIRPIPAEEWESLGIDKESVADLLQKAS